MSLRARDLCRFDFRRMTTEFRSAGEILFVAEITGAKIAGTSGTCSDLFFCFKGERTNSRKNLNACERNRCR
jgi:hypothetical protein